MKSKIIEKIKFKMKFNLLNVILNVRRPVTIEVLVTGDLDILFRNGKEMTNITFEWEDEPYILDPSENMLGEESEEISRILKHEMWKYIEKLAEVTNDATTDGTIYLDTNKR
jgi:hypothetical protein